jgi:hypothetical protein
MHGAFRVESAAPIDCSDHANSRVFQNCFHAQTLRYRATDCTIMEKLDSIRYHDTDWLSGDLDRWLRHWHFHRSLTNS